MNFADRFAVEAVEGRLRAVECALQSLILTHPNPAAFGETLQGLLQSIADRYDDDPAGAPPRERESFRAGCEELTRAAEVAVAIPGKEFP